MEALDLLDGFRESEVNGALWRREEEGDGFRKIARNGVAFVEKPRRDARRFGGPFGEPSRGDSAFGAAAGKERDAPDAVRFGCGLEVGGKMRGFGCGGGG